MHKEDMFILQIIILNLNFDITNKQTSQKNK